MQGLVTGIRHKSVALLLHLSCHLSWNVRRCRTCSILILRRSKNSPDHHDALRLPILRLCRFRLDNQGNTSPRIETPSVYSSGT